MGLLKPPMHADLHCLPIAGRLEALFTVRVSLVRLPEKGLRRKSHAL